MAKAILKKDTKWLSVIYEAGTEGDLIIYKYGQYLVVGKVKIPVADAQIIKR